MNNLNHDGGVVYVIFVNYFEVNVYFYGIRVMYMVTLRGLSCIEGFMKLLTLLVRGIGRLREV